jgi:hypothetical protein
MSRTSVSVGRTAATLCVGFGVIALWGCGGSTETPPAKLALQHLAIYYGKYIASHKGSGPKNEAEFKTFIKNADSTVDLDKLFVSDRDSQPYTVIYAPGKRFGPSDVIAYEKEGAGGIRFVAFGTTQVRELDQTEFQSTVGKK